MHWWFIYGALTLAMLKLAWEARADLPGVWGAALILAATWSASNLAHFFLHPHPREFYPVMDSLCAATFALSWGGLRRRYLGLLALLFVAQGLAHAVFYNFTPWDYAARYRYDLTLNLLYLAQLVCIAVPSWHRRTGFTGNALAATQVVPMEGPK